MPEDLSIWSDVAGRDGGTGSDQPLVAEGTTQTLTSP